ncbi:hypothetical protein QBC39DRAFT_402869 [Podospora conica]|nr:hypothetical protein QBC39DRAFT_402869 [Schizothecium conicum]
MSSETLGLCSKTGSTIAIGRRSANLLQDVVGIHALELFDLLMSINQLDLDICYIDTDGYLLYRDYLQDKATSPGLTKLRRPNEAAANLKAAAHRIGYLQDKATSPIAARVFAGLKGLQVRVVKNNSLKVKAMTAAQAATITQLVMRDMLGGIFGRLLNTVDNAATISGNEEVPAIIRRFYNSCKWLLQNDADLAWTFVLYHVRIVEVADLWDSIRDAIATKSREGLDIIAYLEEQNGQLQVGQTWKSEAQKMLCQTIGISQDTLKDYLRHAEIPRVLVQAFGPRSCGEPRGCGSKNWVMASLTDLTNSPFSLAEEQFRASAERHQTQGVNDHIQAVNDVQRQAQREEAKAALAETLKENKTT